MDLNINCELQIKEAKVIFGEFGRIEFSAHVYLKNDSRLRIKEAIHFQMNLDQKISEIIQERLEFEAMKSLEQ